MRHSLWVGMLFCLAAVIGCAGCDQVVKEVGPKPATEKALEAAQAADTLAAETVNRSAETVELTAKVAEETRALTNESPPALKTKMKAQANDAEDAAKAARKTHALATKLKEAVTLTVHETTAVDREVTAREPVIAKLVSEVTKLRKSAQTGLLGTLLAHVALLVGLASFAGAAYALIALKSKLLATGAGIFGVVCLLGYFVTIHATVIKTGVMGIIVLVLIAVVAKFIFFREATKGIASSVKDHGGGAATIIASTADSRTPEGLGAWLGKLKLRV